MEQQIYGNTIKREATSEIQVAFTSLTVSEMLPNFFLRTSEVFAVSDSMFFWEKTEEGAAGQKI